MRLGVAMPMVDIGGEPRRCGNLPRRRRQSAMTGSAPTTCSASMSPTDPAGPNRAPARRDLYHDPFVLFGSRAGCTNIGDFSTQVLVLPQRQTVLVAKQAA